MPELWSSSYDKYVELPNGVVRIYNHRSPSGDRSTIIEGGDHARVVLWEAPNRLHPDDGKLPSLPGGRFKSKLKELPGTWLIAFILRHLGVLESLTHGLDLQMYGDFATLAWARSQWDLRQDEYRLMRDLIGITAPLSNRATVTFSKAGFVTQDDLTGFEVHVTAPVSPAS